MKHAKLWECKFASIAILIALFLVPFAANAGTLQGELLLPGGSGEVSVEVTALGSAIYEYHYYFTNTSGAKLALSDISVGYGSTDPVMDLKDVRPIAGGFTFPGNVMFSYDSGSNVAAYFMGAYELEANHTYDFTVKFDGLMVQQNFLAFDIASNSALGGTIRYSSNNYPVPEPTTLLLVGSGIFGMGVYSRRKTKKSKQ